MFQMKNRWKNILVGCLTVFGILIPSLSCRAENVGSIQIEYHGRTQENEEVVFANADFSVFFVGKMEDGKWTLAGDFGNAGVSLEGIESSEKNEQPLRSSSFRHTAPTQEINSPPSSFYTSSSIPPILSDVCAP